MSGFRVSLEIDEVALKRLQKKLEAEAGEEDIRVLITVLKLWIEEQPHALREVLLDWHGGEADEVELAATKIAARLRELGKDV